MQEEGGGIQGTVSEVSGIKVAASWGQRFTVPFWNPSYKMDHATLVGQTQDSHSGQGTKSMVTLKGTWKVAGTLLRSRDDSGGLSPVTQRSEVKAESQ